MLILIDKESAEFLGECAKAHADKPNNLPWWPLIVTVVVTVSLIVTALIMVV